MCFTRFNLAKIYYSIFDNVNLMITLAWEQNCLRWIGRLIIWCYIHSTLHWLSYDLFKPKLSHKCNSICLIINSCTVTSTTFSMIPTSRVKNINSLDFNLNSRVANDFLYMGGQMNVENLAGNQYINFSLVSLTELPSGINFMNI